MLSTYLRSACALILSLALWGVVGSCRSVSSRQPATEAPVMGGNSARNNLALPKDQVYAPRFGEWVSVKFKIVSKDISGAQAVPTLSNVNVNGGDFRNIHCSSSACSLEILYSDRSLSPDLSFQISNSPTQSIFGYIPAEKESFTYLKNEQTIPSGKSHIVLTPGVNYQSSWNRPLSSVVVKSAQGLRSAPSFTCSTESCVADVDVEADSNPAIIWSPAFVIGSMDSQHLNIRVIKSPIRALKIEAVIDGNGTELVWEPGVDYLSETKNYATKIQFLTENINVSISSTTCDDVGVCKALVKYEGTDEFTLIRYQIERGSEKSAVQTIKLKHQVRILPKTIDVYADSPDWQTITLAAGPSFDYQDANNANAISVSVQSHQFIEFKTESADGNNDFFKCDMNGSCSAAIKILKHPLSKIPYFNFSIKTTKGASPIIARPLNLLEDKINFSKRELYVNGLKTSDGWESFRLQIGHNQEKGYKSLDFATQIKVPFNPSGVEFSGNAKLEDRIWTSPCTVQGECRLEGRFKSSDEPKGFHVVLSNAKSTSEAYFINLVNQDHSAFIPVKRHKEFKPLLPGQDKFSRILKLNDLDGYEALRPAKILRITKLSGLAVTNAKTIFKPDGEEEYQIDCDIRGDCQVDFQSYSLQPNFVYYLADDDSNRSIITIEGFAMPLPFAGLEKIKGAEGERSLEIHLEGGGFGTTGIEFLDPKVTANNMQCNTYCSGTITLNEPLAKGKVITIPYVLFAGGIKSNTGTIELEAGETIQLKPDTVLTGTHLGGDFFTFTLTSSNLTDFRQKALWILFNRKINIEMTSDSELSDTQCYPKELKCTYTIKTIFTEETKTIEAKTRVVSNSPFFPDRSFKIELKKSFKR